MFEPVQNKRVYQQVVDQIQQQIFNGELKLNDKLPSERDLVNQLQVSRTSVREALRALEVTGLIEGRQGEGNYISGTMEETLLQPLTAMFLLNGGTSEDLLEFRTIIEVNASRIAAKKANQEQKAKLLYILDQLGDSTLEDNKAEMDVNLHYYIAEITGNSLIMNTLTIISTMMDNFIATSRLKILENPNNQQMLFKNHEDIVQAITTNNPEASAKAMQNHMDMVNRIVFNNEL